MRPLDSELRTVEPAAIEALERLATSIRRHPGAGSADARALYRGLLARQP